MEYYCSIFPTDMIYITKSYIIQDILVLLDSLRSEPYNLFLIFIDAANFGAKIDFLQQMVCNTYPI